MEFKIKPVEMISSPNYYAPLPDNRWIIKNSDAQTLWFQLFISDSLGDRPYTPSSSDTFKIEFLRADNFQSDTVLRTLQSTSRTIEKVASMNSSNRSLMSITLTSADVSTILSGSVRLTFTDSANTRTCTWSANYIIKKELTDPGF